MKKQILNIFACLCNVYHINFEMHYNCINMSKYELKKATSIEFLILFDDFYE